MPTSQSAKYAVTCVFVLNGLAFASWVARVPAIRDTLELTPGGVGLLLLCLSAGTVVIARRADSSLRPACAATAAPIRRLSAV